MHICVPAVPVDIAILHLALLLIGLCSTTAKGHLLLAVSYVLLRSSEVTDLSHNFVLVTKCSAMCNSEKWISSQASHHSSPTVCIAETMYEIHVGLSLIYKLVRHFDQLTELQHSQTASSQDSAKSVTRLHYSSTSSKG